MHANWIERYMNSNKNDSFMGNDMNTILLCRRDLLRGARPKVAAQQAELHAAGFHAHRSMVSACNL